MTDTAPLRVLIADDEPLVRAQLRRLLGDHGVDVVCECADGESVLRDVLHHRPDAVLLDIQMPRLDGLQVARRLGGERRPWVVFVTAYDEHAIDALRANAVDYLLKPIEPHDLAAALGRVRERMVRSCPPITRLALRGRRGITVLDLATVDRIIADGNYVIAYSAGRAHSIRRTLASIEAVLDARRFARVHRSAIVNLASVREVQPWFRGEYVALLASGAKVRIGASYRDAFFARIETAAV
ncbi:MAG TPA: LytTR family DNA-binding domain-containing protein [Gemmatimonadaceae bacterium]|nr:LytTR family DNA-binding domain-containing protein [Gemmatimonadaceae bacterium]